MIYSIVPMDVIYFNEKEYNTNTAQNMYYKGELVQYFKNSKGEKIIQRVLSTNLKTYLDTDFQPGEKINM